MNNRGKAIVIGAAILIGLLVVSQATFVVDEAEQVVITQFGKPTGDAITTPGLHWKTPFIQKANYFEKRYLEWDGDPNQVPTKGKKFIFVDTYARWQITDPLKFFKRVQNERKAQSRLDDVLDGETRNFIAKNYLEEVVRSTNREPYIDTLTEATSDNWVNIAVGRDSIQKQILEAANRQTEDLGIVILDFRFKRANYVENVRQEVYKRMQSERIQIADKFRSEGQGEASRINGEKERELKSIQSEAFRQAEEIRGRADAEAAAIYSNAYNKNRQSIELYAFLKSMETLEQTSGDGQNVILTTESDLFRYLKSAK